MWASENNLLESALSPTVTWSLGREFTSSGSLAGAFLAEPSCLLSFTAYNWLLFFPLFSPFCWRPLLFGSPAQDRNNMLWKQRQMEREKAQCMQPLLLPIIQPSSLEFCSDSRASIGGDMLRTWDLTVPGQTQACKRGLQATKHTDGLHQQGDQVNKVHQL